MDRRMSWCAPLALMLLPTAQAAEPGFYVGVTASRVEHDVQGGGFGAPITFDPPPFPAVPSPPGTGFRPFPPGFGDGDFIIGVPIFTPIVLTPGRVEVDDGQLGWNVTLGYRVNRYFAAEVAYMDFGDTSVTQHYTFAGSPGSPISPPSSAFSRYDINVSGPAVSLLGTLPLGDAWQLFLRGGVLFADQELEFKGGFSRSEVTYGDEVLMAGAGVQWSFASRWTARLEYQRTDDLQHNPVARDNRLEQASLSVLFSL